MQYILNMVNINKLNFTFWYIFDFKKKEFESFCYLLTYEYIIGNCRLWIPKWSKERNSSHSTGGSWLSGTNNSKFLFVFLININHQTVRSRLFIRELRYERPINIIRLSFLSVCHILISTLQDSKSNFMTILWQVVEDLVVLNNCCKNYCSMCIEVKPQKRKGKYHRQIISYALFSICYRKLKVTTVRGSDENLFLLPPKAPRGSLHPTREVFLQSCMRSHSESFTTWWNTQHQSLSICHAAVWEGLFICISIANSTINLLGQELQLLSIPCLSILLI